MKTGLRPAPRSSTTRRRNGDRSPTTSARARVSVWSARPRSVMRRIFAATRRRTEHDNHHPHSARPPHRRAFVPHHTAALASPLAGTAKRCASALANVGQFRPTLTRSAGRGDDGSHIDGSQLHAQQHAASRRLRSSPGKAHCRWAKNHSDATTRHRREGAARDRLVVAVFGRCATVVRRPTVTFAARQFSPPWIRRVTRRAKGVSR
jgi:hypothetical protein